MAEEQVGAGCLPLVGHRTELVGGWGHQEGKDTMVAGAGLPGRHREAEVLQEAGEEEEELHAGQGLPEACAAACGWARGLCEPGSPPPRTLRMGKQTRHPLTLKVPAEKGMKASCLTKRPWASRKCSGWKQKGFSQMVSSFSTDDRLVMSVVPWWQMSGMGGSRLVRGCPDPGGRTWAGERDHLSSTQTQRGGHVHPTRPPAPATAHLGFPKERLPDPRGSLSRESPQPRRPGPPASTALLDV